MIDVHVAPFRLFRCLSHTHLVDIHLDAIHIPYLSYALYSIQCISMATCESQVNHDALLNQIYLPPPKAPSALIDVCSVRLSKIAEHFHLSDIT